MVLLFYTTYISVDLAHQVVFHAKVGKGGIIVGIPFNSFVAGGDFCRLLITSPNSLDPDQYRQIVGRNLDPNRLIL